MGLAGGLNVYGFAAGDPVTYSDPFGLCRVDIRAKSLGPKWLGPQMVHTFVTTTEPDNTRTTLFRGGPGKHNADEKTQQKSDSNGGENGPGYFGWITTTDPRPFTQGGLDSEKPAGSTTVVNDNKPCDNIKKKFAETLRRIDAAKIPYHAYFHAQNSNSVTFQLLLSAGIKPPRLAGRIDLERQAPGWDHALLP